MGFTKSKGIMATAALLFAVVFNLAIFLPEIPHNLIFWLSYSFAILSFFVLLFTILFLLNANDNTKSFLRIPGAKIAWVYFIIQIGLSVYQIFKTPFSYITTIIVDGCVSGLFIILILAVSAASSKIKKQDEKDAQKTLYLKNISVIISGIKTDNSELQSKLERLSEDFLLSDPMSHSALSEIEKQIEARVILLKSEVTNIEIADRSIEAIGDLLKERNQKCKMLKSVKDEKLEIDNTGAKYPAIALSVFGIIAVVAIAVSFIVIPNNKYKTAMELYNKGEYIKAISVFEEIKEFSESKAMIEASENALLETEYNQAKALFDNKEYKLAEAAFLALDDYKDSKKMLEAIDEERKNILYNEAQKLFADNKYEEAIALFEQLDTFKNSKEMIESVKQKEIEDKYQLAQKYFVEQDYVEAIKLFTELGEYKDSTQVIEQINNRLSEDNTLYFGTYKGDPIEWQMVRRENGKMLLLAKNSIISLPYNDEIKTVAWKDCSLRKWLNEEFCNSFSEEQLSRIILTENEGSSDKAFILDSSESLNVRNALLKNGSEWWLRNAKETNCYYINENGTVNWTGELIIRSKGVRPCIWIDLG